MATKLYKWAAQDGTLFDTERDADGYDTERSQRDELLAAFDSSDIYWRDTGPGEVADFLLTHYTVTPKA